ncbi:KEOPS complex component [Halostella sp. JP-L12]|uniref:KEOPS complex subunit Cgi121 n=1 Tax=Halostella TaxID=1843185 RepID=UPI000EF82779|nr:MULTISPECIES: KEOPS complex subunit Cgi121 [Halostella]NHN46165.1 KEOPS complex component [Halostella sp. JP-L12]
MELVEGTLTVADTDALVERLGEIGDEHGCSVQAFDARYVAGREHLERAVALADRAIDRGENVARDRAVEILLYAAGRRQINQALEMGVGEGEGAAVVLVDAGGAGGDEASAVEAVRAALDLEPTPTVGVEHADEERLQAFFDVTDAERAATDATLADLVCERVALLDVEK